MRLATSASSKPVLADFYRSLDPTNTLNPSIGRTSKKKNWA
jgi:D-lactate dehydrogenase